MVEWITIDLKARWRIVEYALKSQLQEIGNSQEHLPVGARRGLVWPVASVDWRGARTGWCQAQLVLVWRFSRKICFGGYLIWILFYFIR